MIGPTFQKPDDPDFDRSRYVVPVRPRLTAWLFAVARWARRFTR